MIRIATTVVVCLMLAGCTPEVRARIAQQQARRKLRRRRLTTSNVASRREAGHRRLVNRRLQIEQQRRTMPSPATCSAIG